MLLQEGFCNKIISINLKLSKRKKTMKV